MSWRKYGFGDMDKDNPRATKPYKLSKTELKYMSNNNIHAERDLAKFSHLAVVLNPEIKNSLLKVFTILFYFNHLNQ